MSQKENHIGTIILAAGASKRMGQPKQLLQWQGKTLIRKIAETALETDNELIIVVLGANSDNIRAEISDLPIQMIQNEDWEAGMSSSVRVGLQTLLEIAPAVKAALFLLTDQPFVTSAYLAKILSRYQANQQQNSIFASAYDDHLGVPALFARRWFDELMALTGDRGARALLQKHTSEVAAIPFPEGTFDLDTPDDFEFLVKNT